MYIKYKFRSYWSVKISKIKCFIKSMIRHFGWDIRSFSPSTNHELQLLKALQRFEVDVVFDIGGNVGQFAKSLRSVGYEGEIVSFEPLLAAHSMLVKSAMGDKRWQVHPRIAIGDREGEIKINVSGNSISSSVLTMLDTHATAAADSSYISTECVPIARLDTVAPLYLREGGRGFLKIDVQGFEWQVLDGAVETLKRVQGIQCEMSLVPLYAGQQLWRAILERLEVEGFTLWAIQNGFTDRRDGRTLQIDGIFFRTDQVCAERL